MTFTRQFEVPLPAPLFDAPAPFRGGRTADLPPPVIRRRETAAHLPSLGDRRAPARFVTLNLFADVTYVARHLRVEVVDGAGYAWMGEILGIAGSSVTLAVAGDALTGTIDTGAAYYSVHPNVPAGGYAVDQIDRGRMPRPR